MKFERSEIGTLFSKLRTAVPEVRAVGNDSTGILLSDPDAFATNLELSIRAELSSPVPLGHDGTMFRLFELRRDNV